MVFGRATPPPLPALPPLPTVPRFSTRPVHPFSVTCAFDRQRGQFVVQAGARAGACAVLAAAVLALGAFAYVRSTLFGGGPKSAAAAVMPALTASATPTVTRTVTPAKTKTSGKAEPSQKAAAPPAKSAKAAKPAKGDQSAVSATPAPTQKASPSKSAAAHRKAETRKPGLNYLVVKNLKTRASAEKARELLLRKGVATTIERNLPGQAAEAKYSLVCMTGFRPESERAQLDKQVKRLKAMKLDPKPVTWRG
jgi:hypothetical protein